MICTTLEQSKKLTEILPIESADMYYYSYMSLGESFYMNCPDVIEEGQKITEKDIPCWSLAALLDVIRKCCERFELTLRADKRYNIFGTASNDFVYHSFDEHPEGIDNSINACVEMICKLKVKDLI